MNCPFCKNADTKVIDKRLADDKVNRRRRECLKCHKRFTTYEKIDNLLTKVRKRDNEEADFDAERITKAIWKAAQAVGGTDKGMAKILSDKVVSVLEDKFGGTTIPTIEQIQDIVENVLVENGHYKTGKAYILYRQQHEKMRQVKTLMVDVNNTIDEYLKQSDWRVKENSNEAFSFSGLLLHTAGKVMSNYNLNEMFPTEVSNAHKKGYIHVHDLSHGVIGYSFYRNETVVVRKKGTENQLILSLEQLFNLVNESIQKENGFEIKYTHDYEVLDENGWTDIERVLRHKAEKPLISFNTINGHNMIVTADHPFITLDDKKNVHCPECNSVEIRKTRTKRKCKNDIIRDYYRCKECNNTFSTEVKEPDFNVREEKFAEDVKMNDYIITPSFSIDEDQTISISPTDGWFIGLFLAEGYYKSKYLSFEINSDDAIITKLLSYLDGNSIAYNLSNRNPRTENAQQCVQGNVIIDVPIHALSTEMQSLFSSVRSYSENKNLPIDFLGCSSEAIGGMISGIIDGDGVIRNDDEWVSRASIRLTSKTLLSQMQFWLENKGINSSLLTIDSFGERKINDIVVKPNKQLYSLAVFIPEEKSHLFSECLKIDKNFKYSKKKYDKKQYSNPRKIEYVKNDNEFVYDITTGTHSFLCNGILAHNCAGWSLKNLLLWGFGGVANKVNCKPAKHLSTVVHQMVNYIGCLQMEFAGAQAFSSVDTLLAPFVRYDNLTYKQVKQNMQQLVFSLNIPSRWGCFSDDTEILTSDGWKKGLDLEVGETIATFNTKTEEIEYLPVKRMAKDHYKGKMKRLKNRITDQLVTPNHRILRRIHNYQEGISPSKYVFEQADSLKTRIPLIPLGGNFKGEELNGDGVNLLSWIVSEGSLCKNERVAIHQSDEFNHDNCEEIRGILNRMEIPFDEQMKVSGFTGKRNCLRFRINRPYSRAINNIFFPEYKKNIPDILTNLSTDLNRKFIDTYMKADGWAPENKIYTKKNEDVDRLQEMAVKSGWGSTSYVNKNGINVVRIIKHPETQISSIGDVDYDGMVWCPTTDNGTVVVRRKGKVFISGNSQYPFSNITFDWVTPDDMKDEKAIVGGKQMDYTYGDCQNEMDMINKAFIEVMLEGDADGGVFTFPIPTYNLTKNFNWDSDNAKLLFELTAKYGLPYFQNYIGSNLDPKSIRAMCCRLNINQTELLKRPGGMWGPGDSTGSIGVVTINVNRLAYEARKDNENLVDARNTFFSKIKHYMTIGKASLEIKREVVERNLKNGLMPFTLRYLGTFNNHFSTIGLCGMNEACRNLIGKDIASPEGKQLAIDTLKFMRERCLEFQKETGSLYNLEATPAEGASYRLAREDKKMYPDIITAGETEPYLTNSTNLPVDYTDDAIAAIEHQNDIQHLYTGGTIFHTFIGEKLTSGESCKQLVRKIAENTQLPYFSITPTFSVCPDHGYVAGEHFKCPVCNGTNQEVITA